MEIVQPRRGLMVGIGKIHQKCRGMRQTHVAEARENSRRDPVGRRPCCAVRRGRRKLWMSLKKPVISATNETPDVLTVGLTVGAEGRKSPPRPPRTTEVIYTDGLAHPGILPDRLPRPEGDFVPSLRASPWFSRPRPERPLVGPWARPPDYRFPGGRSTRSSSMVSRAIRNSLI